MNLMQWIEDRARDNAYQNRLVKDDLYVENPHALKVYVIVRSDILPAINQGIQLAHAIVELGMTDTPDYIPRFNEWALAHKTIVALGVDAKEYTKTLHRAHKRGVPYAEFIEPDLDDLHTAAAFMPMTNKEAKDIFYGLRLAS